MIGRTSLLVEFAYEATRHALASTTYTRDVPEMSHAAESRSYRKVRPTWHPGRLVAFLATIALVGCASTTTIPLSPKTSSTLTGKTIVLTKRQSPDFALITVLGSLPGALLGPFGAASAAHSETARGNEIVRSNGIEDPAHEIGRQLLAELAQKYSLVVTDNAGLQTQGQKLEEVIKPYPTVDLVLDVETLQWLVIYTELPHYGVLYRTSMALIDVKTKTAIAQASCLRKPEKQPNSPTLDELLQNQAARLKTLINAAADSCSDELRGKLWGSR